MVSSLFLTYMIVIVKGQRYYFFDWIYKAIYTVRMQ